MLEEMKQSVADIKEQLNAQAGTLQWLVMRLGGVEETTTSLPDGVALPCRSLDALHNLEVHIADKTVRTKVVSSPLAITYKIVLYVLYLKQCVNIWP